MSEIEKLQIYIENLEKLIKDKLSEGHKTSPNTIALIDEVKMEMQKGFSVVRQDIAIIGTYFKEDGIITSIKCDTLKHNGRLKKLENWRNFLLGAWALATIMTPFMMFLYSENLKNKINKEIDDKLSNKNFQSMVVGIIEDYDWKLK